MKCPFCGHLGDKVVDSRESKEGNSIRRRRECLSCSKRYTSREHIEEIEYRVIKKDGRPEPFHPAHRLYRGHGFVECPPFADYVLDDFSLCMTKLL